MNTASYNFYIVLSIEYIHSTYGIKVCVFFAFFSKTTRRIWAKFFRIL